MAVSDEKTRTLVTIKRDDKETLERIAKLQNRSFNNLVETILLEYIKKERS